MRNRLESEKVRHQTELMSEWARECEFIVYIEIY